MKDFENGDGDDSVVYLRTTPAPARNVDEVQVKLRCKLKWGNEGGPNNNTNLCDLLLNPAESMNQWDEKNQKIKRMNKYIINVIYNATEFSFVQTLYKRITTK